MKKILLFIVVLSLVGCAGPGHWVPKDWAKTSHEQATAECEFEAEKAAPMSDLSQGVISLAMQQSDIKKKCMQAKGFYWVRD